MAFSISGADRRSGWPGVIAVAAPEARGGYGENDEAIARPARLPGALSRAALQLARLLPARLVTGRIGAAYRRSLELEAARVPGRWEA